MHQGRWVALPTGAAGAAFVYRKCMLARPFRRVPQDFRISKLCQTLRRGPPAGLALGHATGDANAGRIGCYGASWRLADENNNV
jgi:hypothetical protein